MADRGMLQTELLAREEEWQAEVSLELQSLQLKAWNKNEDIGMQMKVCKILRFLLTAKIFFLHTAEMFRFHLPTASRRGRDFLER